MVGGLFAERDDALLAALPADVDELLLEVDVGERQVDRLLRAQPGRVDELEQRPGCGARAGRRPRPRRAARRSPAAGARAEAGAGAGPRPPGRARGSVRASRGRASARPPACARPSSAPASAAGGRAGPRLAPRRRPRTRGRRSRSRLRPLRRSHAASSSRSRRYALRVASESAWLCRKRSMAAFVSTSRSSASRRVLLQAMLPLFCVASTKRETALVRGQGWLPWQGRGWALALRDRGAGAGVYCLEGHYASCRAPSDAACPVHHDRG